MVRTSQRAGGGSSDSTSATTLDAGRAGARIELRRPGAVVVGTRVGEGPGVLLLHAGGEHRAVWTPVANALQAEGFATSVFDLRGHGASGAAGAEDLAAHAGDVAAMLAPESSPVTVVGASLGGLAALLSLRAPHVRRRIASVVLIDVIPFLEPDRVRTYLDTVAAGGGDQPLVRDVLRHRDDLIAATSALTEIPILLVRGTRSPLTDEGCCRFTQHLEHARVVTVPDTGHLVARDAPAAVADLLLEELRRADVRRRRIDAVLDAAGVDGVPHPGGTLRGHLNRTATTLESWGAPSWVVDAGRLHAVYGTAGVAAPPRRVSPGVVRSAVGSRAEWLIEVYARCDRGRSHPTLCTPTPTIHDRSGPDTVRLSREQARAFAELTAANELDVVTHSPTMKERHGPELSHLFREWSPLLSPAARGAWDAAARPPESL